MQRENRGISCHRSAPRRHDRAITQLQHIDNVVYLLSVQAFSNLPKFFLVVSLHDGESCVTTGRVHWNHWNSAGFQKISMLVLILKSPSCRLTPTLAQTAFSIGNHCDRTEKHRIAPQCNSCSVRLGQRFSSAQECEECVNLVLRGIHTPHWY